jgi:hypothetical protein
MTLLDTAADYLSGGKLSEQAGQITELAEVNRQYANDLFMVKENLQRLEQALYAPGWRMLSMWADQEFTREGLREITRLARIMRLKNPLIKRGVQIQKLYVWAQGVSITAVDEQINEVIQGFLDDERNQAELTSHQARGEKEVDLQTEGNLFFRFFINRVNGRIRVRTIDPLEIDDIICNPEDKKEPWFYRRTWTRINFDGSTVPVVEYYPDWRFIPRSRLAFTDVLAASGGLGGRIIWDTPVYHVAVNKLGRWGICEFYDANDWALAYKSFLEQLASVWQALARWAAKLTVKGGARGVAAAKAKLNTTMAGGQEETNPPPTTGSMFIQTEGRDLQPFRTAGATMSADDGRRLMLMAAMPFGFPETFYGDASVGSLATAESLDRPTELKIIDRQTLYRDIHMSIFDFVLKWAAKAPQGQLRSLARVQVERDGDQIIERLAWNEGVDPTITMTFPAVIEHNVREMIGAISDAQTLAGRAEGPGIPLETAVARMLAELGIQDIDEVMEIWREINEERKETAAQMVSQFGQNGSEEEEDVPEDEEEDEETMESVFRRQQAAVEGLLTAIRETIGANGQNVHT